MKPVEEPQPQPKHFPTCREIHQELATYYQETRYVTNIFICFTLVVLLHSDFWLHTNKTRTTYYYKSWYYIPESHIGDLNES